VYSEELVIAFGLDDFITLHEHIKWSFLTQDLNHGISNALVEVIEDILQVLHLYINYLYL
jgi:hypothetical protein